MFYPTVAMIKISIVLFNRRLTGMTSRKWMIFHNTLLCLLVLYAVITILINVFICIPFPKDFQILNIGRMNKPPRWINQKPVVPAFSAIHIAFDFILLSVPLIVLSRMKMAFSKKVRLLFLFSIGAVSTGKQSSKAILTTVWFFNTGRLTTEEDGPFPCVAYRALRKIANSGHSRCSHEVGGAAYLKAD